MRLDDLCLRRLGKPGCRRRAEGKSAGQLELWKQEEKGNRRPHLPASPRGPPLLRQGRDSLIKGHLNLWATPRRLQVGDKPDHIPPPTHDGCRGVPDCWVHWTQGSLCRLCGSIRFTSVFTCSCWCNGRAGDRLDSARLAPVFQ